MRLEKYALMRIRYLILFITNGFKTFRKAARGLYANRTDDMSAIYDEIMEDGSTDNQKLRQDFLNVASDIRQSFYKVTNGEAGN